MMKGLPSRYDPRAHRRVRRLRDEPWAAVLGAVAAVLLLLALVMATLRFRRDSIPIRPGTGGPSLSVE